jgi:hypothetical protein
MLNLVRNGDLYTLLGSRLLSDLLQSVLWWLGQPSAIFECDGYVAYARMRVAEGL